MTLKKYTLPVVKGAAFSAMAAGMLIGSAALLARSVGPHSEVTPAPQSQPNISVTQGGGDTKPGEKTPAPPAVTKDLGNTNLTITVVPGVSPGGRGGSGGSGTTVNNTVPVDIKISNDSGSKVTVNSSTSSSSSSGSSSSVNRQTSPSHTSSQPTSPQPAEDAPHAPEPEKVVEVKAPLTSPLGRVNNPSADRNYSGVAEYSSSSASSSSASSSSATASQLASGSD